MLVISTFNGEVYWDFLMIIPSMLQEANDTSHHV